MQVNFHKPTSALSPLPALHGTAFVVFADSHVSERIWQSSPATGDSAYALDQIAYHSKQLFRAGFVHSVIGCGDILDVSVNTSYAVDTLSRFDRMLRYHESPCYLLHGQHDAADPPWSQAVGASHIGNRAPFTLGELVHVRCQGIDFVSTDRCAEVFGSLDCDIAFAHQRWGELIPHKDSAQVTLEQVRGTNVVFSGDTHELRCVRGKNADGKPAWLISPGATHLRAAAEPTEHHFLICDVRNRVLDVYPRVLQSRKIVTYKMHAVSDEKQLLTNMKSIVGSYEDSHWVKITDKDFPRPPEDLLKPMLLVYPSPHGCDKHALYAEAEKHGAYLRFVNPPSLRETAEALPDGTMEEVQAKESSVDIARAILREQLKASPRALSLCERLLELPDDVVKNVLKAEIDSWASSILSEGK